MCEMDISFYHFFLQQEKLSTQAQDSIAGLAANYSIQAITTNLKNVTIAINYLSVMQKYDIEGSLAEFMETTVGSSPKYIRSNVKVKHVVHVWTILKYVQTDALMHSAQVCVVSIFFTSQFLV